MKMEFLISVVLWVCVMGISAWGACPEQENDLGVCDSIYVEPWPADTEVTGAGPWSVRVAFYITHDVSSTVDSVAGIVTTFCFTHSNAAKYCSVSSYWNKTSLTGAPFPRSIFRELPNGDSTWMKEWYEIDPSWVWANIIQEFSIPTSGIRLALIPTTQPLYGEGHHDYTFVYTFRLEDSMQICIDSCFWPPKSWLEWATPDGKTYTPRMGTPHDTASYKVCFRVVVKPNDVRETHGSDEVRPSGFSLSQNYPNPFNPVTNFQFTLPKSAFVKIEIFNIVGQKVTTLVDEEMKPGVYVADWDGKDESGNFVSSGIYFYRMQAGDFSEMKKMVLLK